MEHELELLTHARGYRNRRTDHESKFDAFLQWNQTGVTSLAPGDYIIQFVGHPNFAQHMKQIAYFERKKDSFETIPSPGSFRKANSFKNYNTDKGVGHDKGYFLELNLYIPDGSSAHHMSTMHGSRYERDSSHDGPSVSTKGAHW